MPIFEKLAFVKTSKLLVFLGSKISASFLVLTRYLNKFSTAVPRGALDTLENLTHR